MDSSLLSPKRVLRLKIFGRYWKQSGDLHQNILAKQGTEVHDLCENMCVYGFNQRTTKTHQDVIETLRLSVNTRL